MMRGLKGAMLNNMHLLRNFGVYTNAGLSLLLLVAAGFANEFLVTQIAMSFMLIVLPMSILSGEEYSMLKRWNAFERAFAFGPWLLVASRYILYIATSLLFTGVWFLLPVYTPFDEDIVLFSLSYMWVWAQLICILAMPVMYILNPKNTGGFIFILLAMIFVSLGLSAFFFIPLLTEHPLWLTIGIIIALYAISMAITVVANNYHRGRAS